MFSIFSRKQIVECYPFLRRICDMTSPNMPTADEVRNERRYNRSIPVIVCPWENERPVTDKCVIAITKDISDQGLSVVLNHPLAGSEMIVGFWLQSVDMEEPWFFRAVLQNVSPIGGGYWQLGIALREYMNQEWMAKLQALQPVAAQLLPQPNEANH